VVLLQEIHRPVEMLELEGPAGREVDLFAEPLLVAVQLGARGEAPVGNHREERPLQRRVPPFWLHAARNTLPQSPPLPEGLQDVEAAVGPGVLEDHVRRGRHHLLGRGPAEDALGEASQPLARLGVHPPEVINDPRLGLARLGVPGVLGQLVVGHRRPIGQSALGLAQEHASPMPRMVWPVKPDS